MLITTLHTFINFVWFCLDSVGFLPAVRAPLPLIAFGEKFNKIYPKSNNFFFC